MSKVRDTLKNIIALIFVVLMIIFGVAAFFITFFGIPILIILLMKAGA